MSSINHQNMRYRRLVGMEALENRCLLSVNPIEVGAVYFESAATEVGSGVDTAADYIYVSFNGGAAGTELTEITIDLASVDQGGRYSFIDLGDDNPPGVEGAYGSIPFEILDSSDYTVTGWSLSEGNTVLTIQLEGFTAGDVLKIQCDVDEVLAEGIVDAEVTGAEFSLTSTISASFSADHYEDAFFENVRFVDFFDSDCYDIPGLPNDEFTNEASIPPGDGNPQSVYTAGAFAAQFQVPLPATLSGKVYEDVDYSFDYDASIDRLLSGVTIELWQRNDSGQYEKIDSTVTDANGEYFFEVDPGTYRVFEVTPEGYRDVTAFVGTIDGVPMGTMIDANCLSDITVLGGQDSIWNDFSEYRPASVSGIVWLDSNQNNRYDDGEKLLENVLIELRDENGDIVDTCYTDKDGYYIFTGLLPGEYAVFEHQPEEYIHGGEVVGSEGGYIDGQDTIVGIFLYSGAEGIDYDFWEYEYAEISGYVFQDGKTLQLKEGESLPDNLWELYPGIRDALDNPIAGVTLILADADGNPILDANGNRITTQTDANGYYCFKNVKPGTYSILEEQPGGYFDGIDTPGSLGGDSLVPDGDKIYNIEVDYGDIGTEYNFSEIIVTWTPDDPDNPPPGGPPTLNSPPARPNFSGGGSAPVTPYSYQPYFGATNGLSLGGGMGGGGAAFHLAVLNAGAGRGGVLGVQGVQGVAAATTTAVATIGNTVFDPDSWEGQAMNRIRWMLAENSDHPGEWLFGLEGAKALTGDFNGDGVDELAIFLDGFWFIDINGNNVWDDYDLWVQLGKRGDQPIVGDWDGDGKADIGVFGPTWKGDHEVLAYEHGLPDAENLRRGEYKNIPPERAVAGYWYSKHTRQGEIRRDVIDHVFQIGSEGDIAVAGDWNGDGVWSVGVFNNGTWTLDVDGDGRITERDAVFHFGQKGDIPVVGNWDNQTVDGKAVSKIGVYRDGTWILDVKGTGMMNDDVQIVRQGRPGELPIVGDFDGTGVSKLATYRNADAPVIVASGPENPQE
ncbi:MAG: SdrD B-like domain-containing protein [Planctomycetia bacterium]|nr:SdrD B-like domain-containing protein [Planctomycetia bacterium]